MALSSVAGYLHLGNLLSTGGRALTETQSSPTVGPNLGALSFQVDSFGYHRIFRYVRLMAAGTPGLVFDRVALVTGTVDAPAGVINNTTHLTDANAFTVGDEVGKICQINVAGAAAPEGETALIVSNSASILNMDQDYPFSTAPEVGDTFSNWGAAHYDASGLASKNTQCSGILMGAPVAKDYGWVQVQGFHPAVQVDPNSAAITAEALGQAGATSFVVLVAAGVTAEAIIGRFPMATSTTAVQAAFIIDVFSHPHPTIAG